MITEGILNINKPEGWTSQDVCAKLRGRLHIKKIGHTGTLDPMATGVLPVCIGRATRIIEYYDKDLKSYHATMKLGVVTDTLDITGEVLEETPVRIIDETAKTSEASCTDTQYTDACVKMIVTSDIKRAFAEYTGEIVQIPPKYSALKIGGRRAYDLAREGKEVEIKARTITVASNEITLIDAEAAVIEFDVVCSKGTYIRTICDDIGRQLGCGATMTALIRTSNGYFRLEDALELKDVIEMTDEELEKHIIPADETLKMPGTVLLDNNRVIAFRNGHSSSGRTYEIIETGRFDNIYKVYSKKDKNTHGDFLGMGEIREGELVPSKVMI